MAGGERERCRLSQAREGPGNASSVIHRAAGQQARVQIEVHFGIGTWDIRYILDIPVKCKKC